MCIRDSSKIVIEPIIKLYKARKDPKIAAQIASELAVDGAIDYASWPIRFAKFWMAIGIGCLIILSGLCFLSGFVFHWSFALPSTLFITIIWLNSHLERIEYWARARHATR